MLIFVYGTLKRAHGNSRILRDGKAKYLGDAVTQKKFKMLGYGAPMINPNAQGHFVRGEVWDIGDVENDQRARATLRDLDRLESNGRVYNRVEQPVKMLTDHLGVMPLPRDSGDVVQAWCYEGMRDWSSHASDEELLFHLNCDGMLEWHAPKERQHVRVVAAGDQDDEQEA